MHQTGLTGSWEHFSCDPVTVGSFSPVFGAIKHSSNDLNSACVYPKQWKKLLHKQANTTYVLEISQFLLEAGLI